MTIGQMILEKSLPSASYRSEEMFAREREGIFWREWVVALREDDLGNPGDHRVVDVLGESVLVVRTKQARLAAHYNVCRHRGSRLCSDQPALGASPSGVLPNGTIRCPYHSWTYGLDGALLVAPHLGDAMGELRPSLGLHAVGVDTWGGFVFLNLSPSSARQSLAQQLGPVPERLARYPLAELRLARRIEYDVAANWKVIAENYNECYHCGPVHPELCDVVPAFRKNGGAGLEWEAGIPHRDGAFTFTRSGTTTRRPFPTLSEAEQVRHKGEIAYPNLFLSLSPDHVAAFTLWPQTPLRTRIVCDFLFHPEEIARRGFDPEDAVEFWDLINRQDWAICEEVQRGTSSRVHRHGYYAPMEDLSLDIRRYVTDRIGAVAED
jgi:phenylpropionate dioxygenase-like ring-hydroxylating dioxygenase large terminal subunit